MFPADDARRSGLALPAPGKAASDQRSRPEADRALGDKLEHVERDAIVDALERTRYNKTEAAKRLGLTLRALRYRIKKLGIE